MLRRLEFSSCQKNRSFIWAKPLGQEKWQTLLTEKVMGRMPYGVGSCTEKRHLPGPKCGEENENSQINNNFVAVTEIHLNQWIYLMESLNLRSNQQNLLVTASLLIQLKFQSLHKNVLPAMTLAFQWAGACSKYLGNKKFFPKIHSRTFCIMNEAQFIDETRKKNWMPMKTKFLSFLHRGTKLIRRPFCWHIENKSARKIETNLTVKKIRSFFVEFEGRKNLNAIMSGENEFSWKKLGKM